ncbi:ANTAR domain-containing response regulator [Conexibacter woesei]|uniref:Response regulator receiver and ANTAR domain protein n=1 Tax=Conexibacter woesei (strain DSM 14684 / CCUG 47730 / CIP 108061 / JCM 11494 / NBRC 100937 / ID131577) TaxID=469383 RepID=D3EZJ5_CONWI|nr:ANTAR domain-containing protein [Conexibacter woesei]ADB53833.1 response regulator receiver and ANTAR domain protein [Conexibacter woesei DSM 14684]
MTTDGLSILAADEDHEALERLGALLRELGHRVTAYAISVAEVAEKVLSDDPDVSIVVLHEDDDHALALIEELGASASGPVVALTLRDDPDFVARAADRGIAAYTQPATPDAIQSAIELALRRHAELTRLETKVDQLEGALERRAVIERAKGILMERHDVDQAAAFERLRTHARAARRRVVDVARDVADGELDLP